MNEYWIVDLRYRVDFTAERGNVTRFTVQLEGFFEEKWHPIIRYDTAERFAHRDQMCPKGPKRPVRTVDYNNALNQALDDIKLRAHL